MSESDDQLGWAPAPGHGDEVRYAVDGPLGRVRLNRPQAINALDRATVESLHQQLTAWAAEDGIAAVVLDGAGERGLCAGGDVRSLREAVRQGRYAEAEDFWAAEYAVNALISSYPKPFVAWMDGVVMGGGVGVSAHGSVRLVTERSRLAMPETIIGFFPDVGALHLLAQAPGESGAHAALTGTTFGGADALVLGVADALVSSAQQSSVVEALREDPTLGAADLVARLGTAEGAEDSSLEVNRGWIDECYRGDDATAIVDRLRERAEPAARSAADTIAQRSPHSVAVTLEALRRAASMSLPEVLAQDLSLGPAFARHPDFAEGVRAQLVDKDRQPRWAHGSIEDVSRAEVLAAFGEG